MKLFIRALCCFVLVVSQARAFWIARPIEQRVVESDCIVLARFDGFEILAKGEIFETQLGRFTLERTLKGAIESSFRVHGERITMCVPMTDFSSMQKGDTYLLFLGLGDDAKIRRALEASVFAVVNGRLMWSDPGEMASRERTLQYVERSIRSIAKSPPSQRAKLRS
jgi:hypothetical protein